MAMIVEVLHPRSGEVRQRVRVEAFPFAIGRSLENALILDDPHVDARHARLVMDEDGSLVIEDLGSVNKLATATHQDAERIRVRSGAEVTIGRTTVRFRDESDVVPPALPLHRAAPAMGPVRWHERTPVRLGLIGAALVVLGVNAWFGNYARAGATDALTMALGILLVALVWAGIWAVAARAVIGQFRFVAHLFISIMAATATMLMGGLLTWGQFLAPANALLAPVSVAANLALLAALVAWHLANASTLPARRRWRAGVTVSGVLVALIGLFALVEDKPFSDVPEFSSVIKDAPVAIIPTSSEQEFNAAIVELRDEVDKLRAKAVSARRADPPQK